MTSDTTTQRIVLAACKRIREFLECSPFAYLNSTLSEGNLPSDEQCRYCIRMYTIAFSGNFQVWLTSTALFARHEFARFALTKNVRCEIEQDHAGMLLQFAASCNALPTEAAHCMVMDEVKSLAFQSIGFDNNVEHLGLRGLVALAILEVTSQSFIPILRAIAQHLGSDNLEYCDVHGEADTEHANDLLEALEEEATMGYTSDALKKLATIADATVDLVERVFTPLS